VKIEVHPDDDLVARKAAAIIAAEARATAASRGGFHHSGQRRPHAVVDAACIGRRATPLASGQRRQPIRTETSLICAKACSIMHRWTPSTSMRCRSKQRTSIARLSNTP